MFALVANNKMCLIRMMNVLLVILVSFVCFCKAYKYKTILEDDEIFSKCENQADNVLDIHGLFDMSELIIKSDFDKITVSGNSTLVWDIQLTDRVQAKMQILKFDRGSWQPTIYTLSTPSFCNIMHDKNQYWYESWLRYVTNLEEVKDKCLNVAGTKFIHTPFDLEFTLETHINNLNGHYKIQASVTAFDMLSRMRPTSICIGIRVEYVRM